MTPEELMTSVSLLACSWKVVYLVNETRLLTGRTELVFALMSRIFRRGRLCELGNESR